MRRNLAYLPYLLLGALFGFTLIKAEAASWYRIQEMFHFQSFHMFGIIITAVLTAFVGLQLIKPLVNKASLDGTPIVIPKKGAGKFSHPVGGFIFGIGWGVIGLCPGPIFALIGSGSFAAVIVFFATLHGVWLYGYMQHKLPK